MKKFIGSGVLAFILILISTQAQAASTTLSLSNTGNGDSVQVRVTGPVNTEALLQFKVGNNNAQPIDLGRTDDAGFLSTVVSPDSYGITAGGSIYVTVGSTQSPAVSWPNLPGTVTGTGFSLALDTVTLIQGATSVVPANDLGTGSLTVSNNSNGSVAQVSVNANQVFVTGEANGSDTATICLSGSTTHCQTLSITVGSGTTQSFAVSNTNPAIAVGQSLTDPINGDVSGTFFISSNSNQNVAQANVSYNLITITGSHVGTSNITVCKTSGGCATFTATVIGTGSGTNAAPTLSPTSVSVSVGQTSTVLVAGKGGYFISNNNNPNVASATVSGSSLIVKGLAVGNRIISLCDTNNQCSTLSVTVSAVTLPPTTTTVTTAPTASTQSTTAYQFTTALAPGDHGTAVTALQDVLQALGFLTVTPNGNYGPATKAAVMAFQAARGLEAIGSVGPATRAALNSLASSSSTASGSTTTATSSSATATGDGYVFSQFLGIGSTGTAVTELQKRLATLGFFSDTPTGYYGSVTATAVTKFQAAHSITQAGYVGPATRAALNAS